MTCHVWSERTVSNALNKKLAISIKEKFRDCANRIRGTHSGKGRDGPLRRPALEERPPCHPKEDATERVPPMYFSISPKRRASCRGDVGLTEGAPLVYMPNGCKDFRTAGPPLGLTYFQQCLTHHRRRQFNLSNCMRGGNKSGFELRWWEINAAIETAIKEARELLQIALLCAGQICYRSRR